MIEKERHRTTQIGWLRAAVLGANDGLLSTASLVVGVAATGASHSAGRTRNFSRNDATSAAAALTSAVTFAAGALLPVLVAATAPRPLTARLVITSALVLLAVLGTLSARVGGAPLWRGALRVTFWATLAMGVSALVGRLFGVVR